MKNKAFYFLFGLLLGISNSLSAQDRDTLVVSGIIINGDTIPFVRLGIVEITAKKTWKNRRAEVRYSKLRRDVLKVLPYAKTAGVKFKELEVLISKTNDKRVQKALAKLTEEDIKKQFGKELEDLTMTQGRILIKLIDRETGSTSYVVVQEVRGNLSAFFWQSLARVFGHNLKAEYNPEKEEEDKQIEEIIQSTQ